MEFFKLLVGLGLITFGIVVMFCINFPPESSGNGGKKIKSYPE